LLPCIASTGAGCKPLLLYAKPFAKCMCSGHGEKNKKGRQAIQPEDVAGDENERVVAAVR
jgi:hypothetical protein